MIFIADLIACSTCFGHHYAHHQELESILQVVAACRVWFAGCCCSSPQTRHITLRSTPYRQLENQSTKYDRQQPLVYTLELLMMGIMVPETCWASNKICNKNHLLHLVGILFPHINDDARSKSHQITHTIFLLMSMVYVPFFESKHIFVRHRSFRNQTLGEKINWQLRHDLRQGYIPRNSEVLRTGTRKINQSALGSTWCSEWHHRDKKVISNNVFTVTQCCLELNSRETSRNCWTRISITLFTRINYWP